MTRINVGISPTELTDKHLLAEHREIKRIPNCIARGRYNMEGIPNTLMIRESSIDEILLLTNQQYKLLIGIIIKMVLMNAISYLEVKLRSQRIRVLNGIY